MKISKRHLRSVESLLLALAVFAMFSARSFPAAQAAESAAGPEAAPISFADWLPLQGPTGTITGMGQIKVNGNDVQSGATVLSGSTVSTGSDGEALIDMGQLGRVKLRPNTKIKLEMSADSYEVTLEECTRSTSVNLIVLSGKTALLKVTHDELTNVAVTLGEIRVTPGADGSSETVLKEGESRALDPVNEIRATGDADFTVNCCDCDLAAGGFFFPPLVPILVFGGIAAATPILIGVPGGEQASPIQTF